MSHARRTNLALLFFQCWYWFSLNNFCSCTYFVGSLQDLPFKNTGQGDRSDYKDKFSVFFFFFFCIFFFSFCYQMVGP